MILAIKKKHLHLSKYVKKYQLFLELLKFLPLQSSWTMQEIQGSQRRLEIWYLSQTRLSSLFYFLQTSLQFLCDPLWPLPLALLSLLFVCTLKNDSFLLYFWGLISTFAEIVRWTILLTAWGLLSVPWARSPLPLGSLVVLVVGRVGTGPRRKGHLHHHFSWLRNSPWHGYITL